MRTSLALVQLAVSVAAAGTAAESVPDEWYFSTLDSAGFNARYVSSICLSQRGEPHVFYQGYGRGDRPMISGGLLHAFLEDGVWRSETVDSDCSVFGDIFPVVDSTGTPHVVYQIFNTAGRDGLKYARKQAGRWVSRDIYNKEIPEAEMKRRFGVTSFSLGLMVTNNFCFTADGRDVLHICYLDPEKHTLTYGCKGRKQAEWRWEALEDVGPYRISCSRIYPSIATSTRDKIFVAYKKYETGGDGKPASIKLRLATLSGKRWSFETVAEDVCFIDGGSLVASDAQGGPRIAYYRAKPAKTWGMFPDMSIVYARKVKTEWRYEIVCPVAAALLSVGTDAKGNPRVTFVDLKKREGEKESGPGNLIVASRKSGSWSKATIRENEVSRALALAIDRHGYAHIVFSSLTGKGNSQLALRYGRFKLRD